MKNKKIEIIKHQYSVAQKGITDILISSHLLDQVAQILRPHKHTSYLLLCDKTTSELFGTKIKNQLETLKVPIFIQVIDNGEKSKNLTNIMKILQVMTNCNLDRRSAVIALGGGVVGDLATVLSALYFRGIDCVQIPTTLISQVDSSMGGKGAVNILSHKNTIGVIKQPRLIIIDISLINQLPQKQITSGMAEIVKYGVAIDSELFNKLENAEEELKDELLTWVINRSIKLKMDIVKEDPLDLTGKREILNFGHTLGQAIELQTDLTHGEAVAIGMAFAVKLSQQMKLLSIDKTKRALKLIEKFDLPTTVSNIDAKKVIAQISKDKKSISGTPQFVLIKDLGQALTRTFVPEKILNKVLTEVIL